MRKSSNLHDQKLVIIVAGEASADVHGARLVNAIKTLCPGTRFCGIGGNRLAAEGVEILVPAANMAVVGLTEIWSKVHDIRKAFRELKVLFQKGAPDLLILMDYPEFNLFLARHAKKWAVPVLYYIGPQIWAWRQGRIRKIKRRVDRMAVILPFEEAFYRERGIAVDYVGHPVLDTELPPFPDHDSLFPPVLRGHRGVDATKDQGPVIGLVPGSRKEEVENLLPIMLEAVETLRLRHPHLRCRLPLAHTIDRDQVHGIIHRHGHGHLPVDVQEEGIHSVLNGCHVALVTSGTATLDAAVVGVPMVVMYRMSPLSYRIAKVIIKVPHISLVNLIARRSLIPELIQEEATPFRLAEKARTLLEEESLRQSVIEGLKEVRQALGTGGASWKAARVAAEMMNCPDASLRQNR